MRPRNGNDWRLRHGSGRRQRQQAGAFADRGCGRAREGDRPPGGDHRHGGRDPEGGEIPLWQRERDQGRGRSQDRRDQARAAARSGRGRDHGSDPDLARGGAAPQSGGASRRLHRRAPAPARFRPRRGAERQASDRAEGARGRARAPIRRIQGPRRRDRQRHRQARRIRQRDRRSRPRRGHRAPRRDAAAREFPLWRPHPRLCL